MGKNKQEKCCYNCKHKYNSSTRKSCKERSVPGHPDPCEKFEFNSLCKSFNKNKKK